MTDVDPSVPLVTEPKFLLSWYARSGAGKSALGQQAARDTFRETGLRTRLILADPGSYDPYSQGIDEGYIDHMSSDAWTNFAPNTLYKLLMEGWWPEDARTPNSPLQPGYIEIRLCPLCGKDSGSRGAAHADKCVSCNQPLPPGRLSVQRRLTSLAGIGLVIAEGFSVIGDTLLNANRESRPGDSFYVAGSVEYQDLARKANDASRKDAPSTKDNLAAITEAKALLASGFISLSTAFAPDHYLKAHTDLVQIISQSKKLPVPMVIWTGHEGAWEVQDEPGKMNSKKTLKGLGPAVPVMKRVKDAGRPFTILGHIAVEDGEKRVLHLDSHVEKGNTLPWLAKCNILGMPKKLELGDPTKVNNFTVLRRAIEAAKAQVMP